MQVHYAKIAWIPVLKIAPLLERADIIADMDDIRGLYAGKTEGFHTAGQCSVMRGFQEAEHGEQDARTGS
jgi:hypothetical protein